VPQSGRSYAEGKGEFPDRHRVCRLNVGHRLVADGPQCLPGELEFAAFLVQPCVGRVESCQHRAFVAVCIAQEKACLEPGRWPPPAADSEQAGGVALVVLAVAGGGARGGGGSTPAASSLRTC